MTNILNPVKSDLFVNAAERVIVVKKTNKTRITNIKEIKIFIIPPIKEKINPDLLFIFFNKF